MKIAILQPVIPHYREPFFKGLSADIDIDYFIYESKVSQKNRGINPSSLECKTLKNCNVFNKFRIYNPVPLMSVKYDAIVLPGELRSISTWFLLAISKLKGRKVILWGHGISIHDYLKEEIKLNPVRVLFNRLSSLMWLYTDKEKEIWCKYIRGDKIISLRNTVEIRKSKTSSIDTIREKYNINTPINFIFCARFTQNRRIDLFLKFIEKLDKNKYGFIIIGEGNFKPDFSNYRNVYDFGAVYDADIKNELFRLSNFYFQPAWVGLSIVEAMKYGCPVLTFKRSKDVLQCVEYGYIESGVNGYIADDLDDLVRYVSESSVQEMNILSQNTTLFAEKYLQIESMINSAKVSLNSI